MLRTLYHREEADAIANAIAKRKTTTSTEVKNRYNDKVYKAITVRIPKDTAEAFKDECRKQSIPQRQVLLSAIENFLRDK